MAMQIAATGDYPPPPEWGQNVVPGYFLDEQGVLVDFKGGGFPFPDIAPDDPQIAVKVIWNMLWRPGQDDYMMPMVAWLRGEHGQLDREYEFTGVSAQYALGANCLVPGYEEVRSKMLMEFRSPRDMAGAKNLSITYVDPLQGGQRLDVSTCAAQAAPHPGLGAHQRGDGHGFHPRRPDGFWRQSL